MKLNGAIQLFNGFFSDDYNVVKATKKQIDNAINETVRFLEENIF